MISAVMAVEINRKHARYYDSSLTPPVPAASNDLIRKRGPSPVVGDVKAVPKGRPFIWAAIFYCDLLYY